MFIAYFGILTFADKIGGYPKTGHRWNLVLTIIFVGIWYYLNNF